MSATFGVKYAGFFEIYGVSARTGGLSQRGHFADKGEGGQFFAILCGRLFLDGPLSCCVCDFLFWKSKVISVKKNVEQVFFISLCYALLFIAVFQQ